MTAALHKGLQRTTSVPSAFLLGSVAPDMPLYLLSLGGTIYYRLFLGWSSSATFHQMFDYLYFQHPVWIAAHNLLHSPTLLLLALTGLWSLWSSSRTWLRWGLWFGLACLLHSIVDIVTHVDDGPLLLFPFEWTVRFQSPVSYWDSTHYGREFTVFELTLDVLLLGYLYGSRVWSWLTDTAQQRPADVLRDQSS
jgi:hypothetical protein